MLQHFGYINEFVIIRSESKLKIRFYITGIGVPTGTQNFTLQNTLHDIIVNKKILFLRYN